MVDKVLTRTLLAFATALAFVLPVHGASSLATGGTITVENAEVAISPEVDRHRHRLVVAYEAPPVDDEPTAEGATTAEAAEPRETVDTDAVKPSVEVLGSLDRSGVKVDFSDVEILGRVADKHYWTLDMTVTGMEPGEGLTVPLWISLGDLAAANVPFTIRPIARDGALDWSLTPPAGEVLLSSGNFVDFTVTTGDKPATDVTIMQSTLQEETTRARIGVEHLELCHGPDQCGGPVNVPRKSATGLLLRIDGFERAGKYKGNVTIGATNGAAGQSFELTVFSSPDGAAYLGWAAIAAGLLLAFFVNVFARNYLARARALLPAARVAERIGELRERVAAIERKRSTSLHDISDRLADMAESLDPGRLRADGLLPAWYSEPFAVNNGWAQKLKSRIEEVVAVLLIQDALVREGLVRLDIEWQDAHAARYTQALKDVDGLAGSADLDAARAGLATIFQGLPSGPGGMSMTAPSAPAVTVERLEFNIGLVSGTVWGLWLAFSLVAGAYVVIYSNPGFGITLDYFKCFFWGLGFGVGGQTLQQLTPAATAQKFGIALPKSE